MLKNISICNYKGFYARQRIDFAAAEGTAATGLTVLVGANNSGKTSVFDALKIFSQDDPHVDSEFRHSSQLMEIEVSDGNGNILNITNPDLGSTVIFQGDKRILDANNLRYVGSRRNWAAYTSNQALGQKDYWRNMQSFPKDQLDSVFVARIAKLSDKDKAEIKKILKEIVPQVQDWRIDRSRGQLFVQYETPSGSTHSSDLFGDGLSSLFRIAVAVHDCIENNHSSESKQFLCIDEPELSLHPQAQKMLANYISNASAHIQICAATHSPYFVRWRDLARGTKVYRVSNLSDGIKITTLSGPVREKIESIYGDWQKPNLLDAVAREIFFGKEVVYFEGQEDIGLIRKYCEDNELNSIELFGYGVGGSGNIAIFLQLAKDLNLKACAIYDGDKIAEMEATRNRFPDFLIEALPVDDIRDKMIKDSFGKDTDKIHKEGLFDKKGILKDEYKHYLEDLMRRISTYMIGD